MCICISEYASNGSLYAFLRNPNNELDFKRIVKWAEDIARGKHKLSLVTLRTSCNTVYTCSRFLSGMIVATHYITAQRSGCQKEGGGRGLVGWGFRLYIYHSELV